MLNEQLSNLVKQHNRGIITNEEAANKAFDIVLHTGAHMGNYIDPLTQAQKKTKNKELLCTRLIQTGIEEQDAYLNLFNLLIQDHLGD